MVPFTNSKLNKVCNIEIICVQFQITHHWAANAFLSCRHIDAKSYYLIGFWDQYWTSYGKLTVSVIAVRSWSNHQKWFIPRLPTFTDSEHYCLLYQISAEPATSIFSSCPEEEGNSLRWNRLLLTLSITVFCTKFRQNLLPPSSVLALKKKVTACAEVDYTVPHKIRQ
jgi:hypothetical protein